MRIYEFPSTKFGRVWFMGGGGEISIVAGSSGLAYRFHLVIFNYSLSITSYMSFFFFFFLV